jgi:hypothetical protein
LKGALKREAVMIRDQMINFLEAALVLLMLTNAFSIAAAVYAVLLAHGVLRKEAYPAAEYRLLTFLARCLRTRA